MNHLYLSVIVFSLVAASCMLVFTSNMGLRRRIAVVSFLVAAGLVSYRAMNMVYGYPSSLQNDFDDVLVLGYWPDQPNNAIYIWVKEHNKTDPITYKVPYSIPLHKQLEGMRAQNGGSPYRSKIKSKNYPLEKFDDTVDDVEIEPLPVLPPKEITN